MRNSNFGRRGLPLALAAVLVVSAPFTHSTWAVAASNTRELISSELPAGVTMKTASVDQAADAVHAAVKSHPDKATDILRVAIMAWTARYRDGKDFKDARSGDPAECPTVRRLTQSAISGDPDRANDLTQMALSLAPGCADSLNSVADATTANDPTLTQGYNSPDDLYGGFGVGFGPGFPGSPGFTGSPPSGAISLPTASPTPVTSAVNG